ncbi:MAG TPA: hypothetical protein VFQ71_04885 [Gaiellales bacterium]|jgi:hypothetical protein|nr:hypothetical protein [Gaiellales bacterium]
MPADLAAVVSPHRVVTVVGLAKNAGKTTVINHLLERLEGPVGLASLGLDGEARDQLTGLAKPRVRPPAGSLVATAEGLAGKLPVAAGLPYRTAVGRVVLVEPEPGRPVIVSGPARLDELDGTVRALFAAGMRRVLLEGALGRLGPAAPERADAVVVAAGAAASRGPDDIDLALRLAVEALALPVEGEAAGLRVEHAAGFEAELAGRIEAEQAALAEVAGAVTGPLLELLMRRGVRLRLVAADATHVLARPQQIARARRAGIELAVRRPLPIVALTASPFHPEVELEAGRAYAAAVAAAAGRWPVYDVVSGRMSA